MAEAVWLTGRRPSDCGLLRLRRCGKKTLRRSAASRNRIVLDCTDVDGARRKFAAAREHFDYWGAESGALDTERGRTGSPATFRRFCRCNGPSQEIAETAR